MINTVPNQITAGRFVLTIVLYVLLGILDSSPGGTDSHIAVWAFIIFVVAAVTDFLDGYIARHMHQISPLGRILDPFVDKLLICGAMVFLSAMPRTHEFLPSWIVVVVLVREFFVTGLRGLVEHQGQTFEADLFGKIKMGLQCIAIGVILFHAAWGGAGLENQKQSGWSAAAAHVFVWAMLIATVISGVIYAFKARGKVVLDKLP